jgi:hypothetical protein
LSFIEYLFKSIFSHLDKFIGLCYDINIMGYIVLIGLIASAFIWGIWTSIGLAVLGFIILFIWCAIKEIPLF